MASSAQKISVSQDTLMQQSYASRKGNDRDKKIQVSISTFSKQDVPVVADTIIQVYQYLSFF